MLVAFAKDSYRISIQIDRVQAPVPLDENAMQMINVFGYLFYGPLIVAVAVDWPAGEFEPMRCRIIQKPKNNVHWQALLNVSNGTIECGKVLRENQFVPIVSVFEKTIVLVAQSTCPDVIEI
jgi:hypothetical protein